MPKTYIGDNSGSPLFLKKIYFGNDGGSPILLKKMWCGDDNGVPRLIYAAGQQFDDYHYSANDSITGSSGLLPPSNQQFTLQGAYFSPPLPQNRTLNLVDGQRIPLEPFKFIKFHFKASAYINGHSSVGASESTEGGILIQGLGNSTTNLFFKVFNGGTFEDDFYFDLRNTGISKITLTCNLASTWTTFGDPAPSFSMSGNYSYSIDITDITSEY